MHRKLFNALWLLAAIFISSASAQEARKPEQASAVVKVDSGQLQGVEADGVISFERGSAPRRACGPRAVRGLPVFERLASGWFGRSQSACDGLDLRRRFRGRFEFLA